MKRQPSFPRWVLYPLFFYLMFMLVIMVRYNITAR